MDYESFVASKLATPERREEEIRNFEKVVAYCAALRLFVLAAGAAF